MLAVLNGAFGVTLHLKPLLFRADLIGGLILGAGIALAGACPGTSLAQIGAGYRDAWFVVLGGIAGAMAFGYFNEPIATILPDKGDMVAFDRLLGLPFWMVARGAGSVLTAGLVVLERVTSWRDEVGADVDGLSPKVADADAGEPHRRPMPRGA